MAEARRRQSRRPLRSARDAIQRISRARPLSHNGGILHYVLRQLAARKA